RQIEVIDTPKDDQPVYLARMVPTVWLLTQTRTSRVFVNKTVEEIVREVLGQYKLSVEIKDAPKQKRAYVVQYQESDWDFLQRWLEREGLCYWFAQSSERTDVLWIAPGNDFFPRIGKPTRIEHRGYSNLEKADKDTVWDYNYVESRTARRVTLFDYHDQKPRE